MCVRLTEQITLFAAIALIGLLWATGRFAQRALSKHDKLSYLATYLTTLGTLITLGLILGLQFGPTVGYVAWGVVLVFVVLMAWAYLPYKNWKSVRFSRLLQGAKVMFVLSCFLEVVSAYILYFSGYVAGSYAHIIVVVEVLPNLLVDGWYLICLGIVVGSVGIASGTFGFVAIAYRRGLVRAAAKQV